MSTIQEMINKMSVEDLAMRLQSLKVETKRERRDIKALYQKVTEIKNLIAPALDEMDRIERQITYKNRMALAQAKRKETIAKNKAMAKIPPAVPAESPPSKDDRKMIFLSGL